MAIVRLKLNSYLKIEFRWGSITTIKINSKIQVYAKNVIGKVDLSCDLC
jgi:hypothetical protein